MGTLKSIFSVVVGLTLMPSLLTSTGFTAPVQAAQDPQLKSTLFSQASKMNIRGMVMTDAVSKEPQSATISDTYKEKLATLALPFIQNIGQTDPHVRYYADTFAGAVFVTSQGLRYSFVQHHSLVENRNVDTKIIAVAIDEKFIGSYGITNPEGVDRSISQVNYFVSSKDSWKSNIPTYNAVSLGQVWPQVDVTLKVQGKNIEKIFTIQPRGNVDNIRVAVGGINSMSLDKDGKLLIGTQLVTVSMTKPYAYQEINGVRHTVQVSYSISKNSYGFEVGNYDSKYSLIIDPLLASTYIGGDNADGASAITLDSSGNVYITGRTESMNYPTTAGAYQTTKGGFYNAFISKLNPGLTSLLASTYIGGNLSDQASAITLDSSGNVYITGQTSSTNYPTTAGAYQTTFGGTYDAFVSKLTGDLAAISCPSDEQGEIEDQGETATQETQEDQGEQGEQNEHGNEDCNGQ